MLAKLQKLESIIFLDIYTDSHKTTKLIATTNFYVILLGNYLIFYTLF